MFVANLSFDIPRQGCTTFFNYEQNLFLRDFHNLSANRKLLQLAISEIF